MDFYFYLCIHKFYIHLKTSRRLLFPLPYISNAFLMKGKMLWKCFMPPLSSIIEEKKCSFFLFFMQIRRIVKKNEEKGIFHHHSQHLTPTHHNSIFFLQYLIFAQTFISQAFRPRLSTTHQQEAFNISSIVTAEEISFIILNVLYFILPTHNSLFAGDL